MGAKKKEINLLISKKDMSARMKSSKKVVINAESAALKKYAKLVSQADTGATTH